MNLLLITASAALLVLLINLSGAGIRLEKERIRYLDPWHDRWQIRGRKLRLLGLWFLVALCLVIFLAVGAWSYLSFVAR